MNTLARCSEGPEALAGLELQHDLQLSLSDWRDWQGVTVRLIDSGAEPPGLTLRNAGGLTPAAGCATSPPRPRGP